MPKLKCPVEGCSYAAENVDEMQARIKLIAHVAVKHAETRGASGMQKGI
jgi:hypothetical protein